jgi:SAM-dependent methyltransferase
MQAELLGVRPGERVLDLGCGPGTDLGLFADAVGDGLAVGIDRSYAMAEKAVAAGAVQCCDGAAVGLRSAQFDATWVRAVLIHARSPAAVLAEVLRLLRPGGRVVVVEPDHGTHIAGPCDDDVFERVRQHRVRRFRNPRVGRSLKHLLVTAGYEQVTAQPAVLHFDDFAVARAAGGPFDRAVEDAIADGVVTTPEGQEYLRQLQSASDRGAFFFAAASVVASGRRPH